MSRQWTSGPQPDVHGDLTWLITELRVEIGNNKFQGVGGRIVDGVLE